MDTGSYSSYSALQGPLILIAVSVHQQPVAILAVLVLIHLLAATSFGSKLLTTERLSRPAHPAFLPAPTLQPAITFFVTAPASLEQVAETCTLALALVITGQRLIG